MLRLINSLCCLILLGLVYLPAYAAAGSESPPVDPLADKILQQMGDYLKDAGQFTFHVEATVEKVQESGQKIQYSANSQVAVRRPDGIQANTRGDLFNERYWYDGRNLTRLDTDLLVYSTAKVPGSIDKAFDYAAKEYGISPPLIDIAYSDPYAVLSQRIKTGSYIGNHQVVGTTCHHLAFSQDNADWQVWIEDGWMPVPRKVVITYKKLRGAPQYTAYLSKWDLAPGFPDSLFTFLPPPEAVQVNFQPMNR